MAKEVTSLKKAYCPKCKTDNELQRIFMVNPDVDICYCPNCMSQLKPKDVIDNYNYFISTKINKAEKLLYRDTNFAEAYAAFGHVIEIETNSYRARFGRILSLTFMSKLRKSTFDKAVLLLATEAEQYFHKVKEQSAYVKFLHRLDLALEVYLKRLIRKITVRDRFYDSDFIEIYYLRIQEVLNFKQVIADELTKSYAKTEEERTVKLLDTVNDSIKALTKALDDVAVSADGFRFKLIKITSDKQVYISELDEKLNAYSGYIKYKLHDDEKKARIINDKVYPDNYGLISMIIISFPLMIINFIVGAGCFISSFIVKDNKVDPFLYIAAGVFVAVGIGLLATYIVNKVQLGRRRHLID